MLGEGKFLALCDRLEAKALEESQVILSERTRNPKLSSEAGIRATIYMELSDMIRKTIND